MDHICKRFRMIHKILLTINFIINPLWWYMSEKYDADWDKKVNDLLDKNKFHKNHFGFQLSADYRARLGDHDIWLGNYPFYYGINSDAKITTPYFGRPSRYTIWRIKQRYKLDRLSKEEVRDFKLKKLGI